MKDHILSNIGLGAISIISTLEHIKTLPLSKAILILPLLSHRELLAYLSNKNSKIRTLDSLIVDKVHCFSNFNDRFYSNLLSSLEAIQFLNELEFVFIRDSSIHLVEDLSYNESMGRRANKIYSASSNVALLLGEDVSKLYLNLRIEL